MQERNEFHLHEHCNCSKTKYVSTYLFLDCVLRCQWFETSICRLTNSASGCNRRNLVYIRV